MFAVQEATAETIEYWRLLLARVKDGDLYFTPEYVLSAAELDRSKLFLATLAEGEDRIIFPFLMRDITPPAGIRRGQALCDITTPYGYTGPLVEAGKPAYRCFRSNLVDWYRSNGVVSEFVRFNPFVNRRWHPLQWGAAEASGEIVWVPLALPLQQLWTNCSATHRRNIRKAEQAGLVFERCPLEARWGEFVVLYAATMTRLGAKPFYFFSLRYFETLFTLLGQRAHLFRASHGGTTAAFAVCLEYNGKIHYHLGCSNPPLWRLRPNNFLFWKIICWSKEQRLELLNLGGGVQQNDSLFAFKAGFSPYRKTFFTGRTVIDSDRYIRLTISQAGQLSASVADLVSSNYFPAYRCDPDAIGSRRDSARLPATDECKPVQESGISRASHLPRGTQPALPDSAAATKA